MKRVAWIVATLLSGCYAPPSAAPLTAADLARLAAEHPARPGTPSWDLDVEAAIAYARSHGASALAHHDLESVAVAQIDAAGQLTNPELRIGRTFDSELGAVDRVFVGLRLHPDAPWARSANVAAARADADAERSRSRSADREVATQIRRLYATLAFGDATRAVITKQLDVLADRQKLLAAQVQRGAATQLDAVLADEDLVDLELQRANLEVALTRAQSELTALLGVPAGQTWKPTWDLAKLGAVETQFDQASLRARALEHRPELVELGHEIQGADARAYRERTRRIPWIDMLQIERSARRTAEWAISVQISLPVLSLNGGAIAAADATIHRARAERERLGAQTLLEVDAAVELARTTGARATALAQRLPPLDKAVTELARSSATSAIDPVKLLLVQERHGRTERAVLAAALDHRLALIALGDLIGIDH